MTMTPLVVGVALAAVLSASVGAQRGRQGGAGEKPKVDVVQTVGCAERKSSAPETWWLTRAADTRVVQPGVFSVSQVSAAKAIPLGTGTFQLIGVADFLDTEGLLRSGRRKEFTTAETANATGELREGRKLLVKGMLVDAGDVKRINLLAVIALADACE
jgi:hypothetical protein